MFRTAARLSALGLFFVAGCSAAPAPLPGGPPPEYEAPRPYPLATASASAVTAPAAPPLPFGSVDTLGAAVDAYMAGYGAKWGEAHAPSGVLVVAVHGEPLLVRTYGKADRQKGTAQSLTTRYRIGSLTKQFTAAATLTLVDAGAVKLDESVRTYVPELPESYKPVTIQMLLQQTAGTPSFTDDPAVLARKTEQVPEADVIGWIGKHPPSFTPGSKWEYSNSNYYLLSIVVERASKQPFETYLTTKVLTPAGMKVTSSVATGGDSAVGYTRGPGDALVPAAIVSSALPLGAGFLVSNAKDLLQWDRALAGTSVLTDAEKTRMFTPNLESYAMGWIATSVEGTKVTWHNGAIDGYGSFFARAPEKDLSVIFLSNLFDFDATTAGRDVLKMALGGAPVSPIVEKASTPIDEAYAKSITGDYVITKETKAELEKKLGKPEIVASIEGFTIAFEGGNLSGKPSGQGALTFRRSPEGALFSTTAGVEITPDFGAKKPSKTALGFTLKQGGLSVPYVRGKLKTQPKKTETAAKVEPPKKAEPKSEKPQPKK